MNKVQRLTRSNPLKRTLFCLCFLWVCSLNSIVTACPTCKNDLQHSGSEFGFAASILLMMSAPFCIFAGWTIVIFRLRRQMKLEDDAEGLSDLELGNLEIDNQPQTVLS